MIIAERIRQSYEARYANREVPLTHPSGWPRTRNTPLPLKTCSGSPATVNMTRNGRGEIGFVPRLADPFIQSSWTNGRAGPRTVHRRHNQVPPDWETIGEGEDVPLVCHFRDDSPRNHLVSGREKAIRWQGCQKHRAGLTFGVDGSSLSEWD